jgi:hypothetical protein
MTVDLGYIRASNGSGEAVRPTVTNVRTAGATTLKVDSLVNVSAKFIATTGTLNLSTGKLDPASVTVFLGHISGVDVIIDQLAPGYVDAGNSVGQVVLIKPTTEWADMVHDVLAVAHNADGTLKTGVVTAAKIDFTTFTNPIVSSSNLGTRVQSITPSGGAGVVYSVNNPTIQLAPGTYLLLATASARAVIAAQDSSFEAAIYNDTTASEVVATGAASTGGTITIYPHYSVEAIVTPTVNTTYSGRVKQTYGTGASYTYIDTSIIAIPLLRA